MSEEQKNQNLDEMSPVNVGDGTGVPKEFVKGALPTNEYRVAHNRPPMALVVIYILVILWAAISWIPFYGY